MLQGVLLKDKGGRVYIVTKDEPSRIVLIRLIDSSTLQLGKSPDGSPIGLSNFSVLGVSKYLLKEVQND